MNKQWHDFRQTQGALINNDQVSNFSDIEKEREAVLKQSVIADLSNQALIEVSGDDAQSFLQGQFSNDINLVTEQQAQLSSYSTPKGRMLAIFRIFMFEGNYYLITSQDIKDALIKRLRMFVLMSKVKIEDATDKLVMFGIHGDLCQQLENMPKANHQLIQQKDYCIIHAETRLLYIGYADALIPLWTKLVKQGFQPVAYQAWHITDIQQGIPAIYQSTSEMFIPQMLNLDILDGINFKKGCYTGQEVVARLHYLGKQKRKMYLASVESDIVPAPGDELFAENESSQQGTGNIVDIAQIASNQYLLLVMVQIEALDKQIHLKDPNGAILSIKQLPYQS